MLVLENEEPMGYFLIYWLHKEDPEFLQCQHAITNTQVCFMQLFEDKLVLLGRAIEGEHGAPIVVLLPEHAIPWHSSCLFIPKSVCKTAGSTFH